MRYIFFSLLLPFSLISIPVGNQNLDYRSSATSGKLILAAAPANESFYTTARKLIQQQINLIARVEQAMVSPDANQMRAVQGQLTVYTKLVDTFLTRQNQSPKNVCTSRVDITQNSPLAEQLNRSQLKIYCSLYASNQELLKLAPILDRLLSRRGELALVTSLPLVTGERQSDPVLSIAPIEYPQLDKLATPFAIQAQNLASPPQIIIGRTAKTAIADYIPTVPPAIAAPEEVLTTLASAKKFLTAAQVEFPLPNQFTDPQETSAILDRFTYDIDPQEPQTYATFLKLPQTGIVRVLPGLAYQRPLSTLENRLAPSVSERYPFPLLGVAQGGFTPSLALQIVGDRFELRHQGVDYSFMVDLGDISLSKLDSQLKAVTQSTREFFLNYQPPKQLEELQVERRRFITGKDQNWNLNQVIFANAKAELNHTYLVRSLQFQLPDMIVAGKPLTPQERQFLNQLKKIPSSDILLAFRPVRRRADGSYTVLWRVLHQFPEPQIAIK
ncbi:hypothetical protein H6G41_05395 [Tolypothrix sp. FACHB-123]|nr:hypothetical protein [Tolypothrix sp. FACHB-123]